MGKAEVPEGFDPAMLDDKAFRVRPPKDHMAVLVCFVNTEPPVNDTQHFAFLGVGNAGGGCCSGEDELRYIGRGQCLKVYVKSTLRLASFIVHENHAPKEHVHSANYIDIPAIDLEGKD